MSLMGHWGLCHVTCCLLVSPVTSLSPAASDEGGAVRGTVRGTDYVRTESEWLRLPFSVIVCFLTELRILV